MRVAIPDPTAFDPDVFLCEVHQATLDAIEHAPASYARGETEDLEGTARVRLAELIVGPVVARTRFVRGPARLQ